MAATEDEETGLSAADLDDNATPFNFGKSLSVAVVSEPRCFIADPTHHSKQREFEEAHRRANPGLYSWPEQDEWDDGLPRASQRELTVDLRGLRSFTCAANALVLEGPSKTTVLTGTLVSAEVRVAGW